MPLPSRTDEVADPHDAKQTTGGRSRDGFFDHDSGCGVDDEKTRRGVVAVGPQGDGRPDQKDHRVFVPRLIVAADRQRLRVRVDSRERDHSVARQAILDAADERHQDVFHVKTPQPGVLGVRVASPPAVREEQREGREKDKHDVLTSEEVVRELGNPGHRTRPQALAMIEPIPRLAITPEVTRFADLLVAERVMPGPSTGDALHVACAAVHRVDFILTWNVRHLANANKVKHLAVVCARSGLASPIIVPPIQLWQEPRR